MTQDEAARLMDAFHGAHEAGCGRSVVTDQTSETAEAYRYLWVCPHCASWLEKTYPRNPWAQRLRAVQYHVTGRDA